MSTRLHSLLRRAAIALAFAVALAILFGTPQSFAGRALCRSDPVITLSDGRIITLYADIEADPAQIASVDYELHAPSGVAVIDVAHPVAETADLETFSYSDDAEAKQFTANTLVTMKDGKKVKVTAYMDFNDPGQERIKTVKKDGESHKKIKTEVRTKR